MENVTNHSIHLRVTPLGATVYIAIYMIIMFLDVTSNGLVILSFLRYQTIRKVLYNHFLFGLGINGFVIGSIAIPLAVYNRIVISELTCRVFTRSLLFFPAYTTGASAFFILSAVTVDRYIAITRPFRYPVIMTSFRANAILILMCFIGLLFGLQPILTFGGDPNQWICELQQYTSPSVYTHNWIVAFVLPSFLMVLFFVYGRIFYIAFIKANPARASSVRNMPSDTRKKARMRATVTSVIVLTTYTVCFLPHSFKYIFETYLATDLRSLLTIQTISEMLTYLYSFVSVVVFTWRSPHFRQAFRNIMRLRRRSPSPSRTSSSTGTVNTVCNTLDEEV